MGKSKSFWSDGAGLLVLLTAGCASVVGALSWYYFAERRAVERSTLDELAAIADIKVRQISNWRLERAGDARVWSASMTIWDDREHQLRVLRHMQESFGYANAVICDPNGAARLQLNSTFAAGACKQRTRLSEDAVLTDLKRDPATGRVYMESVAPIGRSGALILYIDAANFLFPYLQSRPAVSVTSETMLSRVDGDHVVALSPLRSIPDAPLQYQVPVTSRGLSQIREIATGQPLTQADLPNLRKLSGGWYRVGPDYRGVATYSILRLVPGTDWMLTAKIDSAEAFRPVAKLLWQLSGFLVLIVLLYAGGVALIWRNHQLRVVSSQIDSRNEILALSDRLVNSQEDERARIARELHDHFGQDLAVIGLGLSCLERYLGENSAALQQMEQTRQKVLDLATSMRSLSHKLHPSVLEYSGLGTALAEYCEEFEALCGIHISLKIEEPLPQIPPATALAIYRIVQEALGNIAKHAGVKEALVEVRSVQNGIRLQIMDQGRGFHSGKKGGAFGLGLISIRERARQSGGTLDLSSKPGQGTTLKLTFPLLHTPAIVVGTKASAHAANESSSG